MIKGKRIVVTRSVQGNRVWKKYLEERGAAVYEFPTIKLEPVELNAEISHALMNIADFDWVVFTSAAGLRFMRSLAAKIGANVSPVAMPLLATVGPRSADAARKMGYRVGFVPSTADSATLGNELEPVRGRSILLLRTDIATSELADQLAARGAKVTNLSIYRTKLIHDRDTMFEKMIVDGQIDFLTFASSSAVEGFCGRIPDASVLAVAKKIPALAIGASARKALEATGFENIRPFLFNSLAEL